MINHGNNHEAEISGTIKIWYKKQITLEDTRYLVTRK